MKFPKFQYQRILEIIKSMGFETEAFYLVKRRGWIRIEHLPSGQFFTYFKKKETRINERSKEWEHDVRFRIRTNDGQNSEKPDFDSLMGAFEGWIKKLV